MPDSQESVDLRDPELEIRGVDRDSLHTLPLVIIPFETAVLRRARLIKNVRLRSVIELFSDEHAGSGQLEIQDAPREFGWPESPPHPDFIILHKLSLMPSYDAFSLRIRLREAGISVNNYDALKLSDEKNRELTEYMSSFTRPLILQIYGADDVSIQSFEDVVHLFKDPDVKQALDEVPKFLEDYGDIFLSLSYYRQCLDRIEPIITAFLESLYALRQNYQLKQDQNFMRTCAMIQETVNGLMAAITGRFENFDRSTENMWNDINAIRFHRVEQLIRNYQDGRLAPAVPRPGPRQPGQARRVHHERDSPGHREHPEDRGFGADAVLVGRRAHPRRRGVTKKTPDFRGNRLILRDAARLKDLGGRLLRMRFFFYL
jgi:hypothetical protein